MSKSEKIQALYNKATELQEAGNVLQGNLLAMRAQELEQERKLDLPCSRLSRWMYRFFTWVELGFTRERFGF
jgi:hypothetical protein